MKKIITLGLVFTLFLTTIFASAEQSTFTITYKPQVENVTYFGLSKNLPEFVTGGTPILENNITEDLSATGAATVYICWQYRQAVPQATNVKADIQSTNGYLKNLNFLNFIHVTNSNP